MVTLTKKDILKSLKEVYDPEIPVNVVDLGLIHDIILNKGKVHVKMTLTSPGCPMGAFLMDSVKSKIESIKGIKEVEIELIWDPPWSPERMSKRAKKKFGIR